MNVARRRSVELATRPLEPFQREAWEALTGPASSVMLYGGSRSGKTFLIMLWIVLRALEAKSTHAVLRFRFNAIKQSVLRTLEDVCATYWPGRKVYTLNRTELIAEFDNGSIIFFGGLDDKDRTEKILGQEHSTIYLNEASQISFEARNKALTRLAQMRSGLALKEVIDENPPAAGHWTHQVFVSHRDPETKLPLEDRSSYVAVKMNPATNPHIPESYKRRLQQMTPRQKARFWDGLFGSGAEQPLWTHEGNIAQARLDAVQPGELLAHGIVTVVIAVDPSGCHGPEDRRSDEVGIVVVGLGDNRHVYILEDASGRYGPGGVGGWGHRVAVLFLKWDADRVVCETNYGGAMVANVILTVDPNIPVKEVSASKGKAVRAEPVSGLFDLGKAHLCGRFPELEDQMASFSTAGYTGDKSPDRADAMVWGVTALGVVREAHQGFLEWMRQEAEAATRTGHAAVSFGPPPPDDSSDRTELTVPAHFAGSSQFSAMSGNAYSVRDGRILALAGDVEDLRRMGFTPPA